VLPATDLSRLSLRFLPELAEVGVLSILVSAPAEGLVGLATSEPGVERASELGEALFRSAVS
jgi:hypothetical protein